MTNLPRMFYIQQTFPCPRVESIEKTTREELIKLGLDRNITSGQKIGITVGSRGIRNLPVILRTAVDFIREYGSEPYLLAAMGSHGGGTEAGQREILSSLGLTEQSLGARILTCVNCRSITSTASGLPVYTVESALNMDGILVVNRIKPHTSFKGFVESGLVKKLVVGLGGPKGAKLFHSFGPSELPHQLLEIGETVLARLPVLGGLGIVENAYEDTALITGIARDNLITQENELLLYAKKLMPSLPVDKIDLLIVEEIGKNYSGTGMDTNIIGRTAIRGVSEPLSPCIKRIAVFDLSAESHGNATGVGMADFVTQKLVNKIDRQSTYLNCLTSTFIARAAIPMYFDTEEKLLKAALFSLSGITKSELRIVMIRNTLLLRDCLVSRALLPELRSRQYISINNSPQNFKFDISGNSLLKLS